MSVITLYPEEPCFIPISFNSNPLLVYQKNYSDIEEIMISFKRNVTEPDDAYLRLYYKDGSGQGLESGDVLLDESNHTFTANKKETDVLPKGTYMVYIGVKVTGLSKMLWLRVKKDSVIKVVDDGVQQ